jgi:RNA polymerase sigma factor FliA
MAVRNVEIERRLWDDFHVSRRQRARKELLQLYDPFARAIALRTYRSRADSSLPFDDYLQYARVGLLEAVDRYDAARGVLFSTFSAWRIRGAIINGVAKESELSAQRRHRHIHWREQVEALSAGSEPPSISLQQFADITLGFAMGALLEQMHEADAMPDPDPGNDPYSVNETQQLAATINDLLAHLPENERIVIIGHYLEYCSFQDIAKRIALSKGRVSQLHAQALTRLRQWLERRPKAACRL